VKMFSFWRVVLLFSWAKDGLWFTRRKDGDNEKHLISFCFVDRKEGRVYTFICWRFMIKLGIV
jgi:hypothetical protein